MRNQIHSFIRGSLEDKVQGMTGITPYQRWGNAPVLAALALLLAMAWRLGRQPE